MSKLFRRLNKSRVRLAAVALVALALSVSACSSDDPSADSNSDDLTRSARDNPALADALARVDEALTEPTDVGVTEPLSKKPDEGKLIVNLITQTSQTVAIGKEIEKAANLLGWEVKEIDAGFTPETILAAFDAALALNPKPDAIIGAGLNADTIRPKLDEATAADIPFFVYAGGNDEGTPGVVFDTVPLADYQARGTILADYAAVQSNGKVKALILNIPDFKVTDAFSNAFADELEVVCPDECSSEVAAYTVGDMGTKIPGEVVSYLQRNPDTNWLVFGFDDVGIGVPQALAAAGLDQQVKAVGQSGSDNAIDAIVNDRVQVATIPEGFTQLGYKTVDAIARYFNGDSLDADTANLLPKWLQTKDTIVDPKLTWMGPPNTVDTFKELWLLN